MNKVLRVVLLMAIGLFLLQVGSTWAQDLFVSASSGRDANDGTSGLTI